MRTSPDTLPKSPLTRFIPAKRRRHIAGGAFLVTKAIHSAMAARDAKKWPSR